MIIFLKKIFGVANASCKRSDVFKFRARLVSQRVFNSNIQRNDSFQKRSEENGAENRIGFFPYELHFNPLGYCQTASMEHASQSKMYTQNIIINIVVQRTKSMPSEI